MFLFEGNFGNILHTGDCRLTTDWVCTKFTKEVCWQEGKSTKVSTWLCFPRLQIWEILSEPSQQALSNPIGTHGLHSIHVSFIMCEVISGLKHATMCILWPYCKPNVLFFFFLFSHVRLKCAKHANIIQLSLYTCIWFN